MKEETTYGEFKSHTKYFLKQLITKPSAAKLDPFLKERLGDLGVSQGGFVKKLLDGNVIIRKTKVDDGLGDKGSGKPTYSITYKIPANRFEFNLKKVYISLFEKNVPGGEIDEATACAGDGAGQSIQPIGGVISRKTIYMTEEQFNGLMNKLDEATATANAGNYQYDVPFPVDSDDPTMKHNKGKKRGSAENAIGMDRLTESGGYDMSTPEGRAGAEKWMKQIINYGDPFENAAEQWVSDNAPDYPDDCREHMKKAFIAGAEYGRNC